MRRRIEPDSFKFSMLRLLILSPSTRQALGLFLCTWIQVCRSVQFHLRSCFNWVLHSPWILDPDHPPPAKVKTVRVERIVGAGGVQQQSLETEKLPIQFKPVPWLDSITLTSLPPHTRYWDWQRKCHRACPRFPEASPMAAGVSVPGLRWVDFYLNRSADQTPG